MLELLGAERQSSMTDPLAVAKLKMRLRAEQDAEWYEKTVLNIRQEIFGDPEAPFPDNLKAAREWIETEAQKQGGEQIGQLEYVREDNFVNQTSVSEGTRLADLWRHATAIAFLLGWHQCEVVRWILTGLWEPPSPVAYSWCEGVGYTIEVRSPDVPDAFIRTLNQALRKAAFGRQRAEGAKKEFEDSVRRAVALVGFVEPRLRLRRLGKRLHKSKDTQVKAVAALILAKETWQEWLLEWNRRYRQCGWGFGYPKAMQVAYNRAKERIKQGGLFPR